MLWLHHRFTSLLSPSPLFLCLLCLLSHVIVAMQPQIYSIDLGVKGMIWGNAMHAMLLASSRLETQTTNEGGGVWKFLTLTLSLAMDWRDWKKGTIEDVGHVCRLMIEMLYALSAIERLGGTIEVSNALIEDGMLGWGMIGSFSPTRQGMWIRNGRNRRAQLRKNLLLDSVAHTACQPVQKETAMHAFQDRMTHLNGKRFNLSKTKIEHLVNELLHTNSRFTTTTPLPLLSPASNPVTSTRTVPPQPGLLPESLLTLLACSPPPLPLTATVQAPSLEAPPPGTADVVPVSLVQGLIQPHDTSKVSNKPKLSIKYPATLQFGECDDATITPDLLLQMNMFHGLKQGQWHVQTKDVVESLLNLKALFSKVNDAPITEDSLVALMLDPETMKYSIDIIIENDQNLKLWRWPT
ncbi:hypothetical protein ARMGADRAFT_1027594 [Armillaria gallica]|uniref:Uncharacterized protein n=1 Tax=Armillaria gallica TaxID=47427 RepID=A0A2H3DMX6_ARMGA|nr:hypothetical protein ARMGADRAFT_1027594 [Armillaria gallica]